MANVVVLAGGDSDEREISLRSGNAVAKALIAAGHSVTIVDTKDGLNKNAVAITRADVVFPALHGKHGEDGTTQKFLEENELAFVGSSSTASRLCFDKNRYAELLEKHAISVPRAEIVDKVSFQHSELFNRPFVLKPNDGGSSIDTHIVRDLKNMRIKDFEQSFNVHATMLMQELIEGIEITVGILGVTPLPVVEIIPPEGGEFDYANKYNGQTKELCPPEHVSVAMQTAAQTLTKAIHEITECGDMSRTDIMVGKTNELYVLETNTIPGLTDQSLLPLAASKAGLSMSQMCDQLVLAALARS